MTGDWRDPAHESWEELAVGHALHALEPEDEEAFVGHLRGCARCERVLADSEVTAADMAYAAPPVVPSEEFRRRISAIAGDAGRPTRLPAARPRRLVRAFTQPWGTPWVGVAAGLVLVVALGVWNLVLHADKAAKQDQVNQAAVVLRCVEDPTCHQVRLADPTTESPIGAVLVRDRQVDVVVDGLEPNDRRSTAYVLWQGTTPNGPLVAVDAFDVTCRDICVVRLDRPLPRAWESTAKFAVSVMGEAPTVTSCC